MFHYHRQDNPQLIGNPWRLNLGKLVVPNVYVNIDIVKLLIQHYDSKKREICNIERKPYFHVSREAIFEVFDLTEIYDYPIVLEDLVKYYCRPDTACIGWRLPLHMLNHDAPLEAKEGLRFHVNLFKTYLKYTYYSVGQVQGLNTRDFMMIEFMVIVVEIQCLNARDWDFATFITRQIDLSLLSMKKDTFKIYFPHYSVLVHMILFYG